ncbi:MAG: LysR family transcriptional regulator [Synergistales bacterium]|nr:LysR family transcriptional regulator [Synergistales bacterium]
MTLHQLRTFCVVVEEGSFRRAAEKLFLSQPSVSQHIAALEKNYDIRLFQRRGRDVSLTPEGRALYTLAKEVLERVDSIPSRFQEMQLLKYGHLTVGVSPFTGNFFMPSIFKTFRERFPEIKLSIRAGNAREILAEARDGTLELAILGKHSNWLPDSNLTFRSIGKDHFTFIAAPGHPLIEESSLEPSALSGETILTYTEECPLCDFIDDYLLKHQIEVKKTIEIEEIEIAKSLVMEDMGITLMSKLAIKRELHNGDLKALPFKDLDDFHWDIQAIYHSSRGLTYAGWEMLKLIEEKAPYILE